MTEAPQYGQIFSVLGQVGLPRPQLLGGLKRFMSLICVMPKPLEFEQHLELQIPYYPLLNCPSPRPVRLDTADLLLGSFSGGCE